MEQAAKRGRYRFLLIRRQIALPIAEDREGLGKIEVRHRGRGDGDAVNRDRRRFFLFFLQSGKLGRDRAIGH